MEPFSLHASRALAALLTLGLPGATLAQGLNIDNLTRIEQDGADNNAVIEQRGQENQAGTLTRSMGQSGVENSLSILQTGVGNRVGIGPEGLVQDNSVPGGTAPGAPGVNIADITQEGVGNRVDEVVQLMLGAVPGNGNSLTVRQIPGAGIGNNVIGRVQQIQAVGMPGQSAEIRMEGTGNRIELVQQDSLSDLLDNENSITVAITGVSNGTEALRGVALVPGVFASQLVQTGGTEDTLANGNVMQLEIQANGTAFGILQRGRGNRTGPIVIVGDSNAIGIDQDGLDNDLTVGLIEGADNEIGLVQYGTNSAALSLLGESDRNSVLIDQMGTNDAVVNVEGDTNTLRVAQGYLGATGGTNTAELRVTGDENRADLRQSGTGNTVLATIEGDFNNAASGFASVIVPAGLVPGVFEQQGSENSATMAVEGDSNLGAYFQNGTLNSIVTIVTGTDNESFLNQQGSRNAAGLTQTGIGNVAVFFQ